MNIKYDYIVGVPGVPETPTKPTHEHIPLASRSVHIVKLSLISIHISEYVEEKGAAPKKAIFICIVRNQI